MNETILIKNSQSGDIESFAELIKPYESRLYTFLAKMCNNYEAAQDMVQETLINAYKNIRGFRGDAKFSTWIFQIATNNCRMLKRSNTNHHIISIDDDQNEKPIEFTDQTANPEKDYEQEELQQLIDKALQKLDPIYRSVFILSEIDGFSGPEISKILNITLPNVKARLRRAKEKLKTILQDSLILKYCDCQNLPPDTHNQIIHCLKNLNLAY